MFAALMKWSWILLPKKEFSEKTTTISRFWPHEVLTRGSRIAIIMSWFKLSGASYRDLAEAIHNLFSMRAEQIMPRQSTDKLTILFKIDLNVGFAEARLEFVLARLWKPVEQNDFVQESWTRALASNINKLPQGLIEINYSLEAFLSLTASS